jgi:O-antigen ligase
MIIKLTFWWIILLLMFLRGVIKKFRGDADVKYLYVSLFIVAAPFSFNQMVLALTNDAFIRGRVTSVALGRFRNEVDIGVAFAISVILLLAGYYKLKKKSFSFAKNRWLYALLCFCIVSYINPYNIFKPALLAVLGMVVPLALLFKLYEANFDKQAILKGAFDGLAILTIINAALCICYPIMGIQEAATIIYGQGGINSSLRREGYPSAIGILDHPNGLGFMSIIPIAFFVSCYLKNYGNKAIVASLILTSMFVCFFTFSRSSYLGIFIAIMILLAVYYNKNKKGLTRKVAITGGLVVVGVLCLYFYLAEYENLLLFNNVGEMLTARENHWLLGYEIWKQSKIIGIGLNTQVYYLTHGSFNYTGASSGFAVNTAIHNIHIIILTETGILGLATWIWLLVTKFKTCLNFLKGENTEADIFMMAFFAMLIGIILIGFVDISPSSLEVMPLLAFFGYFSNPDVLAKKTVKSN